ncbi:hypothetical protein EV193_108195 [Herbihabitans rhizosphaerae]|uniref:VWA domain containing CoxE-like protein n=1 Tax=Herbihabitans rhizosphaerae TaxID=1872711 RepID=A0A4Q7KKN6_9PSEU|nr:VWA domain-containing protein [Herbihabitans rhizosphaerae]RZS34845.1 hypothetical protein EV193_108195 [Herbihabitans rhizosphaerae]
MSIVDRHVAFLGALRSAGLPVSLAEGLDAARAATAVDLGDRDAVRTAYAATVVKRQAHRPVFDTLFDLWFPSTLGEGSATTGGERPNVEVTGGRGSTPEVAALRAELAQALLDGDPAALRRLARAAMNGLGRLPGGGGGAVWSPRTALDTLNASTLTAGIIRTAAPEDALAEQVLRRSVRDRISAFERLVHDDARRRVAEERGPEDAARHTVRPPVDQVDFLSASTADLSALRREVYPLSRRLATRMSRRRGRRGALDFRRTIRASLSTGGVPVDTRHRPRRPHKPELVVLCDISSSVSSFARFTLLLVYALASQFAKVRTFAFVDRPIEVTDYFARAGDVRDAFTAMEADGVRFAGGGTNYGRVFTELLDHHSDAITSNTALLVLGDARVNYLSPEREALTRLAEKARHAYWLNPEPTDRWGSGDSAAHFYAEIVDMFECRNLVQLSRFVEQLA